jgi:hypothetical protein
VANVVINGVKRSGECASPQQPFEVIHQSRRGDTQVRQGKRIASLIVYYCISSNTARSICHSVRRGADARIANRYAAYIADVLPRRMPRLKFRKGYSFD